MSRYFLELKGENSHIEHEVLGEPLQNNGAAVLHGPSSQGLRHLFSQWVTDLNIVWELNKGSWLFVLPCSIKHRHGSLWSKATVPIPRYGICGLLASGFKYHPVPDLCYFRVSWPPRMVTSPALWWPLQPPALTCREVPPQPFFVMLVPPHQHILSGLGA